jgi:hypothetical protein
MKKTKQANPAAQGNKTTRKRAGRELYGRVKLYDMPGMVLPNSIAPCSRKAYITFK